MRVLLACEFSGVMRDAFKVRSHDAWSCDFLPTEVPGQHYQGDIRDLLERLKGEGVRVRDDKLKTWGAAGAEMANKHTGPGWLVWIPEGE